ncbi:MAG TPA: PDZ domain-containing protein [Gemmatimonadales bacterium]|nr:PDZ domain-containing protein [Gemmatimonadales bacterium]
MAALVGLWLALLVAPRPTLSYTVVIVAGDSAGVRVVLETPPTQGPLRLAMARHPEYDDRFWRQVRDLRVEVAGRAVPLEREDSARWRAATLGRPATVRYRLELPARDLGSRRSWRPFLGATGGLVGATQTFLYVMGDTTAPARVTLALPAGWRVATGLEPTADPQVFTAADVRTLLDSPILVGELREWRFAVAGTPHRVCYWPLPGAVPFDTAAFVAGLERIAQATIAIFGRPPYRAYTFLLQDGATDALEHRNSVTLGAPSAVLARDPNAVADQLAHEFFHTWNLVRIRPRGWGAITSEPPARTASLWWGEGVTLYYADLLLRRAGLEDTAAARAKLAERIGALLRNPGNARISPERASWTTRDPPTANGGYVASYYSQGMVLGQLLDFAIRDSTGGRRGLDDVMRALFARSAAGPGYRERDLEATSNAVCGCDLEGFFRDHVRAARALDFDRFLKGVGLRAVITQPSAVDSLGQPLADLRVFAFMPEDGDRLELAIGNPESAWGRSGLRTGDALVALDGRPVETADAFRAVLARARVNDTVTVRYRRDGQPGEARVGLSGYTTVRVTLEDLPQRTEAERAAYGRWAAGEW